MIYSKLKVYEDGGMIVFQEGTDTPFLSTPKGTLTIQPSGANGFTFSKLVTGDEVASVNNYDDVLDSAGLAYGVTQAAVLTAMNAFFFELGGGGAAVDIIYDNSISGLAATNVQAAIDELAGLSASVPFRYPATLAGQGATFIYGNQVASVNLAANTLRGYLLDVKGEAEITEISATVAGATAVGNALFGVYTVNPATGLPQNLLFQSDNANPFNTNIAAFQTRNLQNIANYTLKKGIYWIMFNADTSVNWFIPLQSELFQIGFGSAAGTVYYGEAHVYTGTMPATAAGTGSLGAISNHAPLVQFTTI